MPSSSSNSSSENSSSESSNSDSLPTGREFKRDVVWLTEKVKSTPRGHSWDLLNREGKVKEVSFKTGMTQKQTREAISKAYSGLQGIQDKRIRVYKSKARGSKMERVSKGIPPAKEIIKKYGKTSRKIFIFVKQDSDKHSSNKTVKTTKKTKTKISAGHTASKSASTASSSTSKNSRRGGESDPESNDPSEDDRKHEEDEDFWEKVERDTGEAGSDDSALMESVFYQTSSTMQKTSITKLNGTGWKIVGEIDGTLDLTGMSYNVDNTTALQQDDSPFIEVIKCEDILHKKADVLPMFLNLNFEEVCNQAAQDVKVLVLAILAQGSNAEHMARLLEGVAGCHSTYFWICCSNSQTGRRVKIKFGTNGPVSEILVLAPAPKSNDLNVVDSFLVVRYSGDTLKDVVAEQVKDAIESASVLLPKSTVGKDYHVSQELRRSGSDREESPDSERVKRVKTKRQQRLNEEPESDCLIIKVLLEDGKSKSRKFSRKGTYQEVYDWIGPETDKEHFSLHQAGSGFLSGPLQHSNQLTISETLMCLVERTQAEATKLFEKNDEVSFFGNFKPEGSLDSTTPDDKDKDKDKADETSREETEKKKKKRKRRKKKIVLDEGKVEKDNIENS